MRKSSVQRTRVLEVVEKRLYVILHGLVCLVHEKKADRFVGHLIDRGSEHEYICGNFRGPEKDIDRFEALELKNVDKGTASFDTDKNVVVSKAKPENGTIFARCTITLPRPDKILHFVCGGLGSYLQDRDTEIEGKPKVISGTRVFQYSFQDYREVQVLRKDGKTVFWPCPEPKTITTPKGPLAFAVLQLYNEPPEEIQGVAGILHNLYEFRDSLIFLGARGVTLKNPILKPADSDLLPYGLTEEWVCPLAMRDEIATLLSKKGGKRNFLVKYGKNMKILGGGGGTQVCGAAGGFAP